MSYQTSPHPSWCKFSDRYDCQLKAFDATGGVVYPFGDAGEGYWMDLGVRNTALRFVVIVDGDSAECVATPEASYDKMIVEQGQFAPKAFTVQPGYAYGDPYGIDEMRPFFRLSLSGGKGRVGIWGIGR